MGSNIIGSSMQHMVSHQDAHGMSMQTMVGHPAAGIRDAGFHALEDVLMALQPGEPAECVLLPVGMGLPPSHRGLHMLLSV